MKPLLFSLCATGCVLAVCRVPVRASNSRVAGFQPAENAAQMAATQTPPLVPTEARPDPNAPAVSELTFPAFLNEVVAANLDYAAQRYNVSIAEVAVAAAKEFPNPTLQLSGNRDMTHHGKTGIGTDGNPANLTQVESRGVGLTQTLELGGKRKYRILAARQSQTAAAATLESFLLNLKLDAAAAFAEALAKTQTAAQKRQAADYLADLVEAQRQRVRVGDTGEVDLLQTRVEEQQLQDARIAAEAEAEAASLALNGFLGRARSQDRLIPRGSLEVPPRHFDLPQLLTDALEKRPDLVALRHILDAAQSGVELAKAQRVPDVEVGLDYTHNGPVASNHPVNPTPSFEQMTLSLSIPLPLWNQNRAGIAAARYTAGQTRRQLEAAELKAEVQLRQAHVAYRSVLDRLTRFRGGILTDAQAVLEARRFSYQRGQSTLLELLEAQRAAADIHTGYLEALADAAKALIDLERAAGLADIEF
jgi:cobalt-zinc-cadmium efflux system outer membrane protein